MIGFLIYIIGGIIAFFLLGLILKDAPKTEEDNYENSVVYACGFILSWITLLIILIAILEVKNNKKK